MKKITTLFFVLLLCLFLISKSYAESPRMVLIENVTSATCPPCAIQNPVFQPWVYKNLANVIPLVYHTDLAEPDSIFNYNPKESTQRVTHYYQVSTFPTVRVNGLEYEKQNLGYNSATGDTAALNDELPKYTDEMSPVTINVTKTMTADTITIAVTVQTDDAIEAKTLQIALAEAYYFNENVGNNGETEFLWIMRDMANDAMGIEISLEAGETKDFTFKTPITDEYYEFGLYGVAFIQDDETREVLQVGSSEIFDIKKVRKIEANIAEEYKYFRENYQTTVTKSITVENKTDVEFDAKISINEESLELPGDWSAKILTPQINLPASGTGTFDIEVEIGDTAFYADIEIIIEPIEAESYISIKTISNIGFLSNNVECAYFVQWDRDEKYTEQTLSEYYGKNSNYALIPYNTETLEEYSPNDFDLIIFTFYAINGIILTSNEVGLSELTDKTIEYIETSLLKGKKVLVCADLALVFIENSFSGGENKMQNENSKAFYYDSLKIAHAGYDRFKTSMEDITTSATGFPILDFDGLNININEFYDKDNYPVYQERFEYYDIMEGSTVEKLMYYGNDTNKVGMVGYYHPQNGVLIHTSMRFVALGEDKDDITQSQNLFDAIYKYMNYHQTGPKIYTKQDSIDFGFCNDKTVKTITVYNNTKEFLSVYKAETTDEEHFKVDISPSIIPQGGFKEIEVTYEPTSDGNYSAALIIYSNSIDNPEHIIKLSAQTASSVFETDGRIKDVFKMDVSPNPVSDYAEISYELHSNTAHIKISIIDNNSKTIETFLDKNTNKGIYSIKLNTSYYNSGVYHIIAEVNGQLTQIPLIVIR
jgi:hypothetical protein